ncbi:hypothetical protein ACQFYA_18320 [Promicromonospora sp. Marseille-Q5078]
MSAHSPAVPPSKASPGRSDAARTSMRRALLASLTVGVVVTADSGWRMLNLSWPFFVGYSLLFWAVLPVVATLAITLVLTLVSGVELPTWFTGGVAAAATGAWTGWAVGIRYGGLASGLVLAAGIVGVTLALEARWPLRGRVVVAVLAAATAAAVVAVLSG